ILASELERGDARMRAPGGDAPPLLLGEPAHHPQPQAQRAVLEGAIPVARLYVRRPYLDAVAARVLHQLRRRVEAHRLAVEQPRAERRRVVALEPGRNVDQQREARR